MLPGDYVAVQRLLKEVGRAECRLQVVPFFHNQSPWHWIPRHRAIHPWWAQRQSGSPGHTHTTVCFKIVTWFLCYSNGFIPTSTLDQAVKLHWMGLAFHSGCGWFSHSGLRDWCLSPESVLSTVTSVSHEVSLLGNDMVVRLNRSPVCARFILKSAWELDVYSRNQYRVPYPLKMGEGWIHLNWMIPPLMGTWSIGRCFGSNSASLCITGAS